MTERLPDPGFKPAHARLDALPTMLNGPACYTRDFQGRFQKTHIKNSHIHVLIALFDQHVPSCIGNLRVHVK